MAERDPIIAAFYNGGKWRAFRKKFIQSKGYICEACQNKNVNPDYKPYERQFHAHHITPITRDNVNNPDIAYNFDNLMCLCQHCHNKVTNQRGVIAPDLMFVNGEVVKIREGQKSNTARNERPEDV